VLGGLLGSIDTRLPFWVSAGLSLANFLFGVFVLPESLPPERRSAWSWRRANPVGALYMLNTRPGLRPLAAISLLGLVANNALPTMAVLYVINRYGWSLRQLSYMLGAMGLSSALVGGLLTGPVVRRIGERRSLMLGLCFGFTGFALFGVAPTGAVLLAAIPLMALRGLADPALTALMTRRVLPSEQGRLQGAIGGLLGIAGLIGPTVYSESYAYFAAPHRGWSVPGAPFLISAALLLIAAMLATWRIVVTPPVE
jgi:DHA1 family tetracycline resistance protein-like MFS transporter